MKEKNLPDDNNSQSVEKLTNEANEIVTKLENEKNLEDSIDLYQKLIKLNNIIEKKFQKSSKQINEITKLKIKNIVKNRDAK